MLALPGAEDGGSIDHTVIRIVSFYQNPEDISVEPTSNAPGVLHDPDHIKGAQAAPWLVSGVVTISYGSRLWLPSSHTVHEPFPLPKEEMVLWM